MRWARRSSPAAAAAAVGGGLGSHDIRHGHSLTYPAHKTYCRVLPLSRPWQWRGRTNRGRSRLRLRKNRGKEARSSRLQQSKATHDSADERNLWELPQNLTRQERKITTCKLTGGPLETLHYCSRILTDHAQTSLPPRRLLLCLLPPSRLLRRHAGCRAQWLPPSPPSVHYLYIVAASLGAACFSPTHRRLHSPKTG